MKIKSLGYKTDFIFNRFDGEVTEFEDYYLVKNTNNPNYFWGNLLLFKEVPKEGDYERWTSHFAKEFDSEKYYHITLAWDSPEAEEGCIKAFLQNGFELEKSVVLSASSVFLPPKYNNSVAVKMITRPEDYEKSVQVQVASASAHLSKETWTKFYHVQMEQYKLMIEAGAGYWFGAWIDNKLVGSLGIFHDGDIGRFQVVSTHPSFQRRGVCSSLVYKAAEYALGEMKLKTLVMVADEEYHAAKIYESIGFKPTERMIGLCWWDKDKHK